MSERLYKTYEEFWPFYLGEHSKPATRMFHFVGTTLALIDIGLAIVLLDPMLLIAAPIAAYGFAWVSHFFIEKNRPATFTYPWWSLKGDIRMYWLIATGRIGAELARLGIGLPSSPDGRIVPGSSAK